MNLKSQISNLRWLISAFCLLPSALVAQVAVEVPYDNVATHYLNGQSVFAAISGAGMGDMTADGVLTNGAPLLGAGTTIAYATNAAGFRAAIGAAAATSVNGANMTNTGAATVGMVAIATDTTGNAWTPSDTIPLLHITSLSLTGSLIISNTAGAKLTIADGIIVTGPAASGTIMTLGNAESVTGVKTFTTPVLGVASATSINKVTITAPATGATLTIADGKFFTVNKNVTLDWQASTGLPVEFCVAASDETTAITASTNKVTFRAPFAFTLTEVRASVNTAPTGSTILIDINESGTTVLSTKLMIDATEKTSTTATTGYVISDSAIADDAEISVDFDQVGSTIAGAGVKVWLKGYR